MQIPTDQETTCVQIAYQIARLILYQVGPMYLFLLLVVLNDLDSLEYTNDVTVENLEILGKGTLENLVIHARLGRPESLERVVRIETIAAHGKLDQSKRVVWSVRENIKIADLRTPVSRLEQMLPLAVTSMRESEAREKAEVVVNLSMVALMSHLLQHCLQHQESLQPMAQSLP